MAKKRKKAAQRGTGAKSARGKRAKGSGRTRARRVARGKARRKAGGGRPRYSEDFRRQVAEHSILHGIHAAAEKFGVSAPSVTTWRKAHGITRATKRAAQDGKKVTIAPAPASAGEGGRGYGDDFRREVADFSILNGIQRAAKKYGVSAPSVTNWRKSFGIDRRSKQKALAAVTKGGTASTASGISSADRRELRKSLAAFSKAMERVIAKL